MQFCLASKLIMNDDRHTPLGRRTSHRSTHLVAKDISRPSSSDPAIKPAISPVHQPKVLGLPFIAWGLEQTLVAPTLEAPELQAELHHSLLRSVGAVRPEVVYLMAAM
jgi:hypothetical protein